MLKQDAISKVEILKSGIAQIFKGETSSLSFEFLYRNAFELVRLNHGDHLLAQVIQSIATRVKNASKTLISSTNDDDLLSIVSSEWINFRKSIYAISDVLLFFEKHYLKVNNHPSIIEIGLTEFRNLFHIAPSFNKALSQQMIKHSIDDSISHDQVSHCIQMLRDVDTVLHTTNDDCHSISYFESLFETPFLEKLDEEYTRKFTQKFNDQSPKQYLLGLKDLITDKKQRFCPNETKKKHLDLLTKIAIKNFALTIILDRENGLEFFYKENDLSSLKIFFSVITDDELFKEGVDSIHKTIRDEVDILKAFANSFFHSNLSPSNANKYFEMARTILARYNQFLSTHIQNKIAAIKYRKIAFYPLGDDELYTPILIFYIDQLIKMKGAASDEFKSILGEMEDFFSIVANQKVFIDLYAIYLEKRLLDKSRNKNLLLPTERLLLKKLKSAFCEKNFSRIDTMCRDVMISQCINKRLQKEREKDFAMAFTVLSPKIWPFYDYREEMKPPCAMLSQAMKEFYEHYKEKFKMRDLQLAIEYGHAKVQINFLKGRKEVLVNIPQLLVIECFNEYSQLTRDKISEKTGLAKNLVDQVLNSMCDEEQMKKNILERAEKDVFKINENFTSTRSVVKLYNCVFPAFVQKEKLHFNSQCEKNVIDLASLGNHVDYYIWSHLKGFIIPTNQDEIFEMVRRRLGDDTISNDYIWERMKKLRDLTSDRN